MGTLLRLVASNPAPIQPCSCRTWGLLLPYSRDLILHDLMTWANQFHSVGLKLLARHEHVAICELMSGRPNQGRTRRVMTELCSWANCARVTLELSPSNQWGADVKRLTNFYSSMGFKDNKEPREPLVIQEAMIRYPIQGRGHVRL